MRYINILLAFLLVSINVATYVKADIDEWNGISTETDVDEINGKVIDTDIDEWNGQAVAGGVSYLHSDDWEDSTDVEDEWDSVEGTDADFTVDADDGVGGGAAAAYYLGNTNTSLVVKDLGSEQSEVYAEYKWKMGAEGSLGSESMLICYLYNGSNDIILHIQIYSTSGDFWRVKYGYYNDSALQETTDVFNAVAGTYYTFKMRWAPASGVGQNDGIVQFWRDDVLKVDESTVDSDVLGGVQVAKFGVLWTTFTDTSYFYFDDWWVDNEDH